MSIINDALKKAQASLQKNQNQSQDSTPPQQAENPAPQAVETPIQATSMLQQQQTATAPQENQTKTIFKASISASFITTITLVMLFFLGAMIYTVKSSTHTSNATSMLNDNSITRINPTQNPAPSPAVASAPSDPQLEKASEAARQTVIPETLKTPPAATTPPPPPAEATTESPQLSLALNGITILENRRMALINNEIYEVGDFVGDKRVITIEIDRVELIDAENIYIMNAKNKQVTFRKIGPTAPQL